MSVLFLKIETVTSQRTTTRKREIPATTTEMGVLPSQQVFLWLPLIVVVVFTAVMILLITIGRKKNREAEVNGN